MSVPGNVMLIPSLRGWVITGADVTLRSQSAGFNDTVTAIIKISVFERVASPANYVRG
jgi:hypothetical protein